MRLSGHRATIKRLKKGKKLNEERNDTGAAEQFHQPGHQFETDAELHIIEKGNWKTAAECKERESFWICKFKTFQPEGMNKTKGKFEDIYIYIVCVFF
jgi:hypothetical protein